jgi:hypothetical protein
MEHLGRRISYRCVNRLAGLSGREYLSSTVLSFEDALSGGVIWVSIHKGHLDVSIMDSGEVTEYSRGRTRPVSGTPFMYLECIVSTELTCLKLFSPRSSNWGYSLLNRF